MIFFFADNTRALNETQGGKLKDLIKKKLVSERTNCERIIQSVQIETSSSLLRNIIKNGQQEEILEASWDFLGLSRRRAEEIKKTIQESFSLEENQVPIAIDFTGSNGNGSSGPCPYKLIKNKNGTTKVDRNDINDLELKKHRYGKVNIEFKEVGDGCLKIDGPTVIEAHNHFRSKCYSVVLECNSRPFTPALRKK